MRCCPNFFVIFDIIIAIFALSRRSLKIDVIVNLSSIDQIRIKAGHLCGIAIDQSKKHCKKP